MAKADMVELTEAIQQLPQEHRQKIEPALKRVLDGMVRRKRILQLVQDALAVLRLDIKYLAFDIQATRQERDEYRHQLEAK